MDNVTHSLVGLALARAGFNRTIPRATFLLVLSANAPDSDIVVSPFGALRYLEAHRGYTHCVLALPIMAMLSVLVVSAVCRQRLPWVRALLLACVGVASHLLLDWTNSYGVRLLLPFSSRWFHLDLNFLYDAVLLLVLALAAVWPWFAGLVSSEIGERPSRGRKSAVAALTFFLLFDCGRAVLHARAIAQLNSHLYEDAPPLMTAALPSRINPLAWTGIVETQNSYRVLSVDTLTDPNLESPQLFYKPSIDHAIQAAQNTEPFRYFRYFSRFPVWSKEPVTLPRGIGTRVDLTDLQFGRPNQGAFHCVALIGEAGHVLSSQFTYGSGRELGNGIESAP